MALPENILLWILLVPVISTAVLFILPAENGTVIRKVGVGFALFQLAITVWLFLGFHDLPQGTAGFRGLVRYDWVPDIGISLQLGVDGISMAMVLLTAIVWFAGTLVSMGVKDRPKDFYILLGALVSGVFGVFLSLDLFFFYFSYELAVVPMYLLIGYWGSANREYATMKLTLYLTVGALVALVGLFMLYYSGLTAEPTFDLLVMIEAVRDGARLDGATQNLIFPLLLVGFATIAPMWPLHTWSPGGHAAAPSAASMMHAGVLMKLGSYAIIRIAMSLLPEGAIVWLPLVAVLCCFNIIYGGYVAMQQKDMKFVVGYSSSSHMGYVLLGIAAISVMSVTGAVFLMFAHGVMTALAFALIGFFYDQTHTRMLDDLGGMAKQIPFIAICFAMMTMASLGLPGFANFAAELLVLIGSWERYPIPTILAVFGLVITATYLLRALAASFLGPANPRWDGLVDAKGLLARAPYVFMLAVLLLFGFWPAPLVDTISSGVEPLIEMLQAAESGTR